MQQERLFAVILAGGKGSRIEDPDKPLIKLSSTPLIELCLQKIQDKVAQVVLSINHNPEKYIHLNLPLIPDARDSYQGPLIGIYSAMEWIENNVLTERPEALLCIPADVPFFPEDLISKLWKAYSEEECDVVWCQCDDQVQPLFSIWSLSCRDKLKRAIGEGLYGPKLIMDRLRNRLITVKRESELEFLNINDQESLKIAQEMINFK